ncbi:MAG: alpha/beta fold hydrolase [Acidimicrobiia bacterium]|nr:alpha/beta fold hydrolase [Acidimicrobiia bacterium]MDH4307679.1 alpha/beta fold hydrolase [Acidimicrobiia bacterium]MDH5292312.1 alpha/beta fold hydrolase [Acidimicrobiia bacterium]
MQATGQLYIAGSNSQRIPIVLELDDLFRIVMPGGETVGAMTPTEVVMQRTSTQTFRVEFAGRVFGFEADDPSAVAEAFLPRLRTPPPPRQNARGEPQPIVEESRDDHKGRASQGEEPGSIVPAPESGDQPAATDTRRSESRLKVFRLEPKFASRLGLPLQDIGKTRKRTTNRFVTVGGIRLAYRSEGQGRPVVLVGGGFGSMNVWRNVVPHLIEESHAVSVDMVGFGASDRIPHADLTYYDWPTHVAYLDACFEALGLTEDLTILCHGWSSIPVLEWVRTHQSQVRAVGYADAILRPLAWPEVEPWMREAIKRARAGQGDEYFLESDQYLNEALKMFAPAGLDQETIDDHRTALGQYGAERLAHMAAIANVPVGGQPSDASKMMHGCYKWLKQTETPKLLILGKPGYLLNKRARALATRLPHQTVATVDGVHLLPETAPDAVGRFIKLWLGTL